MIDMSVISAIAGGLNQAATLAKSLLDMKISSDVTVKVSALVMQLSDLSGKFLGAQTALREAKNEIAELETKLRACAAFAHEKERYVLKALGPDAFAYVPKEPDSGGEPEHSLCCHCHDENRKSHLQFQSFDKGMRVLVCPSCKSEVRFPHGIKAAVITQPRRDRGAW